jgi:hypothetical protein
MNEVLQKLLFVIVAIPLFWAGYGGQQTLWAVQVRQQDEVKCIEGDCENGHGTLTLSSGTQYVGEWKDGERHGIREWRLKNGGFESII